MQKDRLLNTDGDGDCVTGRAGCWILNIVHSTSHIIVITRPVRGAGQNIPVVSTTIRYGRLRDRLAVEVVVVAKE